MNLDPSRRALDHLQQVRLLTDAEHAAATNDPELPNALFRTPAEALAWVVARELIPQAQLADLPARAAAGQENEAQAIVSEATDLISGEFPLPPWAQLHIRLLDRRVHDGVSANALDQLLALQLIDATQHAHSLSMLPTHEEAWAAPDSLPATLAWTVLRAGALGEDELRKKALAGGGAHQEQKDIVAEAIARIDGATTTSRVTSTSTTFSLDSLDFTTSSSSSTSSLPSMPFALPPSSGSQTRTFTWTSSSASGPAPGSWKKKMVGVVVVVAAIALYLLFVR